MNIDSSEMHKMYEIITTNKENVKNSIKKLNQNQRAVIKKILKGINTGKSSVQVDKTAFDELKEKLAKKNVESKEDSLATSFSKSLKNLFHLRISSGSINNQIKMIERKEEKINFIDQQIQSIFSLLKSLKIRNNPSDQKLLNSTKKELEKLYKKKQKLFNEFSNEYILEDYKSNVLKLDVQNAIKKITPHAIQEQYSKLHNIDSVTKEGHGSQFIIDIKRGSGWVISIQDSQKTGNEYTSPKVDPDPDKFDGEAYKNSHIAALEKAFEGEKEWMLLAETVLCQTPFNWMGSPISVMKFQTGDESQGGFPIINLNDSVHFRNVDTTDGIRKSFMTINRNTEGKIISLDFQTLMEIPVSHSIKPGDKNASPLATIHTKLNFSLSFNDKDKTPQIGNIKFEHKLD